MGKPLSHLEAAKLRRMLHFKMQNYSCGKKVLRAVILRGAQGNLGPPFYFPLSPSLDHPRIHSWFHPLVPSGVPPCVASMGASLGPPLGPPLDLPVGPSLGPPLYPPLGPSLGPPSDPLDPPLRAASLVDERPEPEAEGRVGAAVVVEVEDAVHKVVLVHEPVLVRVDRLEQHLGDGNNGDQCNEPD